jgi:hypothetical protein
MEEEKNLIKKEKKIQSIWLSSDGASIVAPTTRERKKN